MGTKTPTYLEKLKAERGELAAELESIKSRLPVNADGDVPDIGEEQFIWDSSANKPVGFEVHGIIDRGDWWQFLDGDDYGWETAACHSTAESCRAAHEKGE